MGSVEDNTYYRTGKPKPCGWTEAATGLGSILWLGIQISSQWHCGKLECSSLRYQLKNQELCLDHSVRRAPHTDTQPCATAWMNCSVLYETTMEDSDWLHNGLCHKTIQQDNLRTTSQEFLLNLHYFTCLCFLCWEMCKLNANKIVCCFANTVGVF